MTTVELLSAFDFDHIGTKALLFQTGYLTITGEEEMGGRALYRLGYEIAGEKSSSHGRLDMAVRTGGHVFLFEFKVVEMASPSSAVAQLQSRDYAAKYRGEASRSTWSGWSSAARRAT